MFIKKFLSSFLTIIVSATIGIVCLVVMSKIPGDASFSSLLLGQKIVVILFWVSLFLFFASLFVTLYTFFHQGNESTAALSPEDRRIYAVNLAKKCGRFSILLGILQIVLIPFIIYLDNHKNDHTMLVTLIIFNVIYLGIPATIFFIHGKRLINAERETLQHLIISIQWIMWTIVVNGVVSLLLGGKGIGLLFIVLLIFLSKAARMIRNLPVPVEPPSNISGTNLTEQIRQL